MDTKELLKKVRKIEIKTRRLSDHIFSGEYHTSFKGRGMTFSEVRQYQFGDDIRTIDWNVTARYNEAHVKVFEEERELTMMLMVDISGSESFGSKNQFKKEIVTEIAATMAFSATQNNDKIGLILFSDQIELYIPPKRKITCVAYHSGTDRISSQELQNRYCSSLEIFIRNSKKESYCICHFRFYVGRL